MTGWWIGLGVIKFLPEFGWQPIVISAAESVSYEKDYSLLKEVPQEIEVQRVGHRQISKEWQYLRRKLKINFDFPDEYKNWYSPALRKARKILQKEKIDLIYSDSAPYTSHFVAMKLKREFNIPWVAEFGDPWSGNDFSNYYYDETLIKPLRKLQKFLIKRGEGNILKMADKIIVIHPIHKQQLQRLHRFSGKEKIMVVTDGYAESDFKELNPLILYPDKLSITFLGSFYPLFRETLLNFLKVVNEVKEDAEVIFIGRGAIQLQKMNRANFTRILHLPKEKVLAFASGSDFLLVIMPSYAKWIPSKIYDYLRLGKPILGIVPEDGDAAKIIREAKAGFILSHNPEKMKEQLKNIFEDWKKGKFKDFHPDWEYIAQFERKKLTKKLANIFDEVAAR